LFFKGSRYADVGEHEITDRHGRTVRYKKVRFISSTTEQTTHAVRQGERLDHIAHRYYRDAVRFWRICDANGAMWPPDLTSEPGRTIVIPPSKGT